MNAKYLRLAILHSLDEDKLTKCEVTKEEIEDYLDKSVIEPYIPSKDAPIQEGFLQVVIIDGEIIGPHNISFYPKTEDKDYLYQLVQ